MSAFQSDSGASGIIFGLKMSYDVPGEAKKKKILFVFYGTKRFRYGVAEVFRQVINKIDREKFHPILLITGELELSAEGIDEDVEIHELRKDGIRKSFASLVVAFRTIKPDLIVSAMEHPNALCVIARAFSFHKCKLVLTTHGIITPRLRYMWTRRDGWLVKKLVRWTYPLADHVVCVSEAAKEDLELYVSRDFQRSVIYNPVFSRGVLSEAEFSSKLKGLIVTSSRLQSFKKVDEVIRSLCYLDTSYRLVVLGDGPEREKLEALALNLGLSNRVKFVGYVNNPSEWYLRAEIFVLASMWEGFGNVLLESMAYGCQVVANANAWAPSEILGYGKYGFLYDGGDPCLLAEAILRARTSPKPVSSLTRYASQFTDERAAKAYEAVFDSLLH